MRHMDTFRHNGSKTKTETSITIQRFFHKENKKIPLIGWLYNITHKFARWTLYFMNITLLKLYKKKKWE